MVHTRLTKEAYMKLLAGVQRAMPADEDSRFMVEGGGSTHVYGTDQEQVSMKKALALFPGYSEALQALIEAIRDTHPNATVMLCVAHKYNNFSEMAKKLGVGQEERNKLWKYILHATGKQLLGAVVGKH